MLGYRASPGKRPAYRFGGGGRRQRAARPRVKMEAAIQAVRVQRTMPHAVSTRVIATGYSLSRERLVKSYVPYTTRPSAAPLHSSRRDLSTPGITKSVIPSGSSR